MAKATLPVNFKDDILGSEMSGKRRYRMIKHADDTVSFEDVTDYSQIGSVFGAAQMNQTNTAVNESADKNKIIESLPDVSANTQTGMIAGALAVKGLNAKLLNYPLIAEMNVAIANHFIVREYIADNVSINSGGIYKYIPPLGVSGYTPIGIVGYSIGNATNSGQNGSYCNVTTAFISSLSLRNMHPSAVARIKLVLYVLYKKNIIS